MNIIIQLVFLLLGDFQILITIDIVSSFAENMDFMFVNEVIYVCKWGIYVRK